MMGHFILSNIIYHWVITHYVLFSANIDISINVNRLWQLILQNAKKWVQKYSEVDEESGEIHPIRIQKQTNKQNKKPYRLEVNALSKTKLPILTLERPNMSNLITGVYQTQLYVRKLPPGPLRGKKNKKHATDSNKLWAIKRTKNSHTIKPLRKHILLSSFVWFLMVFMVSIFFFITEIEASSWTVSVNNIESTKAEASWTEFPLNDIHIEQMFLKISEANKNISLLLPVSEWDRSRHIENLYPNREYLLQVVAFTGPGIEHDIYSSNSVSMTTNEGGMSLWIHTLYLWSHTCIYLHQWKPRTII